MNKKVLRWNFVFQYGWVITNVINSILLFPIYITHIDKDTLGLWVATSSILGWMTLADPGVGEVLQQKIAEMRGAMQSRTTVDNTTTQAHQLENDKSVPSDIITNYIDTDDQVAEKVEIGKSIGSGLMASAIILLISIIVGLVCYFTAGALINKDINRYPNLSMALLITIISTGMQLVSFTVSGINQGLHNSAHVAIASLTANVLFLIVNLLLLYAGMGLLSIALANLARALYINVFNFTSLLALLKRETTAIRFYKDHFKRFIRIFSFTSASKIISNLAGGIDMLVLARYIPPAQITLYELNRRPVNQSNSLIGRHSVALMPLISHSKGTGNKAYITDLIHRQFRLYIYIAVFAAFMFIINYKDLLILWTGKGTFLGYEALLMIVGGSIAYLLGYFMSNMNYALGDIKANSKYLMVKGLIYGVLMFFGAKYYGIFGTLAVGVSLSILGEFPYFCYRNIKLGYVVAGRLRAMLLMAAATIGLGALACWGCLYFINTFLATDSHLSKLLVGSTLFTTYYLAYILISDNEVRSLALEMKNKVVYSPLVQKVRPNIRNINPKPEKKVHTEEVL